LALVSAALRWCFADHFGSSISSSITQTSDSSSVRGKKKFSPSVDHSSRIGTRTESSIGARGGLSGVWCGLAGGSSYLLLLVIVRKVHVLKE
jgi:hypothetical protein